MSVSMLQKNEFKKKIFAKSSKMLCRQVMLQILRAYEEVVRKIIRLVNNISMYA